MCMYCLDSLPPPTPMLGSMCFAWSTDFPLAGLAAPAPDVCGLLHSRLGGGGGLSLRIRGAQQLSSVRCLKATLAPAFCRRGDDATHLMPVSIHMQKLQSFCLSDPHGSRETGIPTHA